MFRATYTSETLPLLLRYVASLGQSGLLHCQTPEGSVIVLSLAGQQVISCTTFPQHLDGLAAVQALLRQSEGTCHFEADSAGTEVPASASGLIGLSLEQVLGILAAQREIQPAHLDLTHIGPQSVPYLVSDTSPASASAFHAPVASESDTDLMDLDLLYADVVEGDATGPDGLGAGPDTAAAESYRLLRELIDGQRSAHTLASALGQPLDEVRLMLAQLEKQGVVRLGTGPVVSAEGVTEFVRGLTTLVGPVAQLLMRDALKTVGATKETIPVGMLPDLKAEVLRGCPASRHPQIQLLFASLASLPHVQPATESSSVRPFSHHDLTHQLTQLLGPIARELVNESLQQVQGSATSQPLDRALIPTFLDALQALLPPARRVEAISLLQSFRR